MHPSLLSFLSASTEATHAGVVVVDDDRAIVAAVCELLADEGITATACPHGTRAYTCIRKKHPQVIILDVQMPEVDGIDLFQQLRADPETDTIPVIFFTANAHKLTQRLPNFRSLGAELLPKPFHVQKLIDAVTRALMA